MPLWTDNPDTVAYLPSGNIAIIDSSTAHCRINIASLSLPPYLSIHLTSLTSSHSPRALAQSWPAATLLKQLSDSKYILPFLHKQLYDCSLIFTTVPPLYDYSLTLRLLLNVITESRLRPWSLLPLSSGELQASCPTTERPSFLRTFLAFGKFDLFVSRLLFVCNLFETLHFVFLYHLLITLFSQSLDCV